MAFAIFFIQALVFGSLSAIIASNKNRSGHRWFFLGLILGPFGFIAVLVVGEVEEPAQVFTPEEGRKPCPRCKEQVRVESFECSHCKHEWNLEEVEAQIRAVQVSNGLPSQE